jgi:hypothetical protein
LLLIFYEEGTEPKLQAVIINSEKDMTIELELETYTKGRLLNEIKNTAHNKHIAVRRVK